uniref:C2 domain-containing protein n=1 Tax=Guillardia theta TaxID=55529 RepID=A0A7S4L090_GUITH|mmetsp:Transcript_34556/g.108331  ORF Transcript_34556/g.108331 Transcript_34556/m.108331 type:complete len:525 (+) Transcript_34556:100-1674(+)
MGVSGGTASLFEVLDGKETKDGERSRWIGKDISHAVDEVGFYEKAQAMKDQPGWGVLSYTFESLGVQDLPCTSSDGSEDLGTKKLLILHNLHHRMKKLRMQDVKIGKYTADADWMGKSKTAAFRNNIVDDITNSGKEGYRLEGFDSMPSSLETLDPSLEMGKTSSPEKEKKKIRRLQFQRLSAEKFLNFLLDLADVEERSIEVTLSREEFAEAVLRNILKQMSDLCRYFEQVPVPQKWIGSSVALGFDVFQLPTRDESGLREMIKVIVNIFDWGRSELLQESEFNALSQKDQQDRREFWSHYKAGIYRLYYELARIYQNRYTSTALQHLRIVVSDYDAMSNDDAIGECVISMKETGGMIEVPLVTGKKLLTVKGEQSKISVKIEKRTSPPVAGKGSRFASGWLVTIGGINVIPNEDRMRGMLDSSVNHSDPFLIVEALEQADSSQRVSFRRSRCIMNNDRPTWNEVFEFPEARSDAELNFFRSCGIPKDPSSLSAAEISSFFPLKKEDVAEGFRRFLACADLKY